MLEVTQGLSSALRIQLWGAPGARGRTSTHGAKGLGWQAAPHGGKTRKENKKGSCP